MPFPSRCPRCSGSLVQEDGGLTCLSCGRAVETTHMVTNGSKDLASCSTDDLVALFKQLHEDAQRNWQARIAVIGELACRLEGSGRNRCRVVAAMLGISEPYCRQLYKVSKTFSEASLRDAKVPASTVIAAAYAPQPERLLKQAEVLHLTGAQTKQTIHAERPQLGYRPGRKPSQEVRACCPECGFEGLMRLLAAPVLI